MLLKKMKASLAVALVMSMSLLTACGGSAEKKADTTEKSGETQAAKEGNAAEGGTIKLGVLAPLTGTNAEYGKGFQIAMQMAIRKNLQTLQDSLRMMMKLWQFWETLPPVAVWRMPAL